MRKSLETLVPASRHPEIHPDIKEFTGASSKAMRVMEVGMVLVFAILALYAAEVIPDKVASLILLVIGAVMLPWAAILTRRAGRAKPTWVTKR
jgi:MFS superfamily sulfate permease-like transporter